jgi:predicted alpha/beta hydrolase
MVRSTERKDFKLPAADGYPLAARIYSTNAAARGVALVIAGMGVRQSFYEDFASWLARQGWEVVTFDLRGIGDSAPKSLRGFEVDILAWSTLDCGAALAFASQRAAGRPLLWIGHSLGGQIFALTPGNEAVAAAVTIACGSGYWRENAYPLRRYSWWLWHVLAPAATQLCGYFPGRRLRMVGDLPKGIIRQWSRWCRHPDYAAGAEGRAVRASYRRPTLPLLSLSFTDDEYMSERNVASLHGFYENARREMRRLAPADAGLARIGHLGFFRPDIGKRLWPMLNDWALTATGAGPVQAQGADFGNKPSCERNE